MWAQMYGKPPGDDDATPQRSPWSYLSRSEKVSVWVGMALFAVGGLFVGAAVRDAPAVLMAWASTTGLAMNVMWLTVARTRKIQAEA